MNPHAHRIIALSLCGGFAACAEAPQPNEIRASGHVEATAVRLAPEVGGRILLLTVKEGDRVEPDALILRLDGREIQLAVQRAQAEQAQAEAQLKRLQAGARREDIAEAQAAGSRVRAADQWTARFRSGARPEEIEAATARVASAAAQVATAEESLKDTALKSPIAGVVTETLAEVGEVIGPRSPVVVITDLARAWADVFVPEPVVPRIRIGQAATLFTDAGGSGVAGTVSYISPKAELAPRNVQTADERSKLVYRVRVSVDNKDGVLKQGMPVAALIALQAQP